MRLMWFEQIVLQLNFESCNSAHRNLFDEDNFVSSKMVCPFVVLIAEGNNLL